MQVAPPGGQFCNQCNCEPSNDQFYKTMQVAPPVEPTDADALAVLAVPAV